MQVKSGIIYPAEKLLVQRALMDQLLQ